MIEAYFLNSSSLNNQKSERGVKMFTQETKYSLNYFLRGFRLVIIITLCSFMSLTFLYGIESEGKTNPAHSGDFPKSIYYYILYPDSGPSIDDVLWEISNRFNNNEENHFTIILSNGTYNQNIYWGLCNVTSLFSELYIELKGSNKNSVQISGDNYIFTDDANLHFKLSNLSISGGSRGIEAYSDYNNNYITFLEMYNCNIHNNISTSFGIDVNMYGAGIYSNGPAVITNCDIYNNKGKNWIDPPYRNYSRGGGIAIVNNTNYSSEITDCNIYGNEANAGGGIYVSGTAPITIARNRIHDNTRKFYIYEGIAIKAGFGEGVYCHDCNSLTFKDNIVYNQIAGSSDTNPKVPIPTEAAVVMESCGFSQLIASIKIENNSIMDNNECHGLWVMMPEGGTVIRNNLSCRNLSGIYLSSYTTGYLTLKYNDAYDNGELNQGEILNYFIQYPDAIVAFNNYELDPQIDTSYMPIWDSSTLSWLIDAGDPALTDSDGTRSDIGAVKVVGHYYEEYGMPVNGGIKWMSFPVLNTVTEGYTTNSNFFAPILNVNTLDWVNWKKEAKPQLRMEFYNDILQNGNYTVSSPVGYKVKVKNEVSDQIKIITTGYKEGDLKQIHLYKYLSGTTIENENWIGYFQKKSAHPLDAFAPVLDKILMIKAQYWSMARDPITGVWAVTQGDLTINYGDMVIVTVSEDCSFIWNNAQPVDPKFRELPEHFEYIEKEDYTPLYLDLTALEELPTEIGIYVDSECKGAVKVEGNSTDICVYIGANETLNPDNCELILYYETKGIKPVRKVYQPEAGELVQLSTGGIRFYTLKLKGSSNLEPVISVTRLIQNYPNPFNPSTTIEYELGEEGPISIEIYNVKGQKIKTLVDGFKVAGTHKVVWDGRDGYGRRVASGIYQYRLTTKDGSIIREMLLLK